MMSTAELFHSQNARHKSLSKPVLDPNASMKQSIHVSRSAQQTTRDAEGDVEKGQANADENELPEKKQHRAANIDNALQKLYLPIYGLSVVTFAAGSILVILPSAVLGFSDLLRRISGGLLFVCGCMLMMNNDLIVTTIRMAVQIYLMRHENARLEESVSKEGKEVNKLRNLSSGLEKLHKQFMNNVQRALKEVARYRASTNTAVRLTSSQLVKWYLDSNSDGIISRGHEQEQAELLVTGFFRKAVPNFYQRKKAWDAALLNNTVYVALDGIPTEKFPLLISALFAKDWDNGLMQTAVDRILCPANMDSAQISKLKTQKATSAAAKGARQAHIQVGDYVTVTVDEKKLRDSLQGTQIIWNDAMRKILGTRQEVHEVKDGGSIIGLEEPFFNSGQPVWYYHKSAFTLQAGEFDSAITAAQSLLAYDVEVPSEIRMDDYSNMKHLQMFYRLWLSSIIFVSLVAPVLAIVQL